MLAVVGYIYAGGLRFTIEVVGLLVLVMRNIYYNDDLSIDKFMNLRQYRE